MNLKGIGNRENQGHEGSRRLHFVSLWERKDIDLDVSYFFVPIVQPFPHKRDKLWNSMFLCAYLVQKDEGSVKPIVTYFFITNKPG